MSNLTGSFNISTPANITGDSDFTYPQDIECTSIVCDEVITDSITTNDLLVNVDLDLHGNILANNKTITATEISYLKDCTGNIQQQINDISSGGGLTHLDYNSSNNAVECDVNFKATGNITLTGQIVSSWLDGQFQTVQNNINTVDTKATNAKTTADDAYNLAVTADATAIATATALTAETVVVNGVIADVATLNTTVSAHTAEITSLDGKTQFMNANSATTTTGFLSNVNIGSSVNPYRIQLSQSGDITCYSINTANTSNQSLDGTNINIGHLGSTVYIGGLIYTAFNPANFATAMAQWT